MFCFSRPPGEKSKTCVEFLSSVPINFSHTPEHTTLSELIPPGYLRATRGRLSRGGVEVPGTPSGNLICWLAPTAVADATTLNTHTTCSKHELHPHHLNPVRAGQVNEEKGIRLRFREFRRAWN